MLESPCTDVNLLPAGSLAAFGDTVRFVPEHAGHVLPANIAWQAAPLGKIAAGRIRLAPRCRALMPLDAPEDALVLEGTESLRALLCGQCVQTSLSGRETGLYWGHASATVPLGRISPKNGRALWTTK